MTQIADRFQSAVFTLASERPIKVRLVEAYSRHLEDIDEEHVPEELRGSFVNLREHLQQHRPIGSETAVEATVRKMSVFEAGACAGEIVTLLLRLLRDPAAVDRLRVVGGARTTGHQETSAALEPPAFLAAETR
ncbi:MAG: hypothetical protein EA371_05525 [Gammaproteobacteria bacterium]|nr:MAG: hypothetical protein EA371_05525 [Gammaproteobacteria bacterium]